MRFDVDEWLLCVTVPWGCDFQRPGGFQGHKVTSLSAPRPRVHWSTIQVTDAQTQGQLNPLQLLIHLCCLAAHTYDNCLR